MKYQLIEDKALEELLREELEVDSGKSEEKEVKEECGDEDHPEAKETKEEDSQVEESKSEEETEEEETEEKEESYDFSEDIKALASAGQGLSEEYKSKASVIFESAVTAKIASEKKKLQESHQKKLLKEANLIAEKLTDRVDEYLNYVTSNWMESNKVAIDAGLRTEIAETFIASMKKVFVENYVEVPESKRDLYAELETKVAKLEESAKTTQKSLQEATKKLQANTRATIVAEAAVGLVATQTERFNDLVKDVEFISAESFAVKVKTIRESYFRPSTVAVKTGVTTSVLNEGNKDKTDAGLTPEMKAYTSALSRKSVK